MILVEGSTYFLDFSDSKGEVSFDNRYKELEGVKQFCEDCVPYMNDCGWVILINTLYDAIHNQFHLNSQKQPFNMKSHP